jgi:hypothetical protein
VQALIFPVVIGLVAYGIGWTTGLARFDPPPIGALIAVFVSGIVVSLVVVSGEEIGWRGYMLTRLIDSGGAPFGPSERLDLGSLARAACAGGRVRRRSLAGHLGCAPGGRDHVVWLRDRTPAARDRQHLASDRAAHRLEQHHHQGG